MKFKSFTSGTIILMYHSIADDNTSPYIDPDNHVPARIFFEQMKFLKKQRTVISLNQLIENIESANTLLPDTVVITFDDGYLDNFQVAAPILEQYRFPYTVFLPTGYISRAEAQWIDKVYCFFKYRKKSKLDLNHQTNLRFDLDDSVQYKSAYKAVCQELMISGADKRKAILEELADRLNPSFSPPRLTMNWDEVRSMKKKSSYFSVGAHTSEHLDLTQVSLEKAENEMEESSRQIAYELGFRPQFFSFCYGRTSDSLRRLARKKGFLAACGGQGIDPVIKGRTDPMRLPRVAAPPSMRRFNFKTSFLNTGILRKISRHI